MSKKKKKAKKAEKYLHKWLENCSFDEDDYRFDNTCGFQADEYDECDECDECDGSPIELSPAPSIQMPRNKRAKALRKLARFVEDQYHIKVLEHKDFLCYSRSSCCYNPIPDPDTFVLNVIEDDSQYMTPKDVSDLVQMLFKSPRLQIEAENVNAEPLVINCRSGCLNWLTGECAEHSSELLFTYCVDAYYLPEDERDPCPVFDNFCSTSLQNDAKKRLQLLEVLGYILSDATGAKSAFFFHGAPDSGKSILLNFASALLDKHLIVNIPLHRLGDKFMVAELTGKKLNVAGEVKGTALGDISNFKSITGGDRMCGEFKGKSPFYFIPKCKLLFAGNTLPETKDTDITRSFVNRLCIVLFDVSIPKSVQDKRLLEKLLEERDTIFSMAMDALADLHKRNYEFTKPVSSQQFLNGYAETQSSVHAFINDMCELDAEAYVFSKDLCEAYKRYCKLNGFDPVKNQILQGMISTLPSISRSRIRADGFNLRGFRGIGLRTET